MADEKVGLLIRKYDFQMSHSFVDLENLFKAV